MIDPTPFFGKFPRAVNDNSAGRFPVLMYIPGRGSTVYPATDSGRANPVGAITATRIPMGVLIPDPWYRSDPEVIQ